MGKIQCPACSSMVDEGMLFCPNCFEEFGTAQEDASEQPSDSGEKKSAPAADGKIVCSECGKESDRGMLFCPNCFNEFNAPDSEISDPGASDDDEDEEEEEIDPSLLIDKRYKIVETYKVTCNNSIYKVQDMMDKGNFYSLREFILTGDALAKSDEIIEAFESRVEGFLKISHPYIAKIFDYFHTQNSLFIVYEYSEGETLAKFLEHFHSRLGHALPEGMLVQIALKLCDILEYLHSMEPEPLYCIDIRPSSLVVSSDASEVYFLNIGIPYILDLLNEYSDSDDEDDESMGSAFRSPKRDIWCVASLIYFLISGLDLQRFDSLSHNAIKDIRPDLSKAFCDVISNALGENRQSNYSSAGDFRTALLEKCKPRQLESYDFYYKFIGFDKTLYEWNAFLCNSGRTSSIGRSPSVPMQSLWRFNIPSCASASVVPIKDSVAVALNDGQIFTVDVNEGKLVWNCHVKDYVNSLVVRGDKIFTSTSSSSALFCLAPGNQNPGVWKTNIDGMLMSGPIVEGNNLYQLSYDSCIFALNSETGSLLWKENIDVKAIAPLLFCDGFLYFGALNGIIYAFNIESRKIQWQYNTGSSVSLACSAYEDSLIAVTTTGQLCSIDRLSSSINWKIDLEDVLTSPVRVGRNMYLCITQKGIMHNISPDGKVIWRLKLGAVGEYSYSVTNNRAYVFSPDGRIMAIDLYSGKLADKMPMKEKVISPPLIYDGKLIFVTNSGSLYCYG